MKAPRTLVLVALTALPLLALAGEPWKAPDDARDKPSPLKADAATVAAGKTQYESRCLNCHGTAGKGDGRGAAYMKVKPEDLTEEDVQAQTDGELFWKVTTGRRPMPGFGEKMTDEERWQVLSYIRELGKLGGASKASEKK